MQIVWAPDADHPMNRALGGWIAAQVWDDGTELPEPYRCFGVFDAGKRLAAAVAFHDWRQRYGTIEFSGAATGKRWLSRAIITEIARYGFDVCGCQLLVSRNDPKDAHLIRMLTALGFERVAVPRMRGRETPEIVMTLTVEARNASRFIRR
jgi:RimJ/RimL family protein N-acetyltransferase